MKTFWLWIKNAIGWLAAASAIFIVGSISWAALDNEPPISIAGPTIIDNPNVPRGGVLRITRSLNRQRFCPGRVARYHIDSRGIPVLAQSFDFPVPDKEEQKRILANKITALPTEIPIPLGMTPGPAQYQGRVLYYCNFLQRVLDTPIIVTTGVVNYNVLPAVVEEGPPPRRNNKNTKDFPAITNQQFESP